MRQDITKDDFILLNNTVAHIATKNMELKPEVSLDSIPIIDGLLEKYKDETSDFWVEFREDFEGIRKTTLDLCQLFKDMGFKDRMVVLEDELAEEGMSVEEFYQMQEGEADGTNRPEV